MIICLTSETWDLRTAERIAGELLECVPRTAAGAGTGGSGAVVWADGRGLDAVGAAWRMVDLLETRGEDVGCGVASTPAASLAAAVDRTDGTAVKVVEPGGDAAYLRDCPLRVLGPDASLLQLMEGVGIETCGELAVLEREAVEVRFGAEAVELWRWSRGGDRRQLFRTVTQERIQASLDFVDYVVTDPERLVFMANRLLGGISAQLSERGAHARRILLTLPLENGETWRKVLRPARPTASRSVWLRLVRRVLERLTVPDAVSGMSLEVLDTEAVSAVQGDLFDAGFATAGAVEAALSRLLESQGPVVVRPERNRHPLAERRTEYVPLDAEMVAVWSGTRADAPRPAEAVPDAPGLTLHLYRQPRPIQVEVVVRRDHVLPVRYLDGEWRRIQTVAGPERITGGEWAEPYAREYFRAVTEDGSLVWLYQDLLQDRWYLHGRWD